MHKSARIEYWESLDEDDQKMFSLINAAKYLGVAPWDLAEKSIYWIAAADRCMEISNELDRLDLLERRTKSTRTLMSIGSHDE